MSNSKRGSNNMTNGPQSSFTKETMIKNYNNYLLSQQ